MERERSIILITGINLGLWLDTSDHTPEQTVQEIFDRARSEARLP